MDCRIPMAAAALSYHLTMTFFPLVICLYTMLGNNYDRAMRAVVNLESFMPKNTVESLESFLEYVSGNYSVLMMIFALSVILITASALFRSLENTIGVMQGGRRFDGYMFFVFSIVLSLLFMTTVYLSIVAMFFSEDLINFINSHIKILHLQLSWQYLRFIIIFGLAIVLVVIIYEICKRKEDHYKTWPGALLATSLLVGVTAFFSIIINYSVKYPLVYSSLASIVILMFWLYCCSLVIYCGAAFNVAIRDTKIGMTISEEERNESD